MLAFIFFFSFKAIRLSDLKQADVQFHAVKFTKGMEEVKSRISLETFVTGSVGFRKCSGSSSHFVISLLLHG